MLEAAAQREMRERRFQGQMVANLLNACGRLKQPITGDELLGLEVKARQARQPKGPRYKTAAEAAAAMRKGK